jgi:hypothetical protein
MGDVSSLLRRIDNVAGRAAAAVGMPIEVVGVRHESAPSRGLEFPAAVLDRHAGCGPDHINYTSLRDTLQHLGGRPATILETGSSAWGANSTCLWDAYVREFGGRVWSVDIRRTPSRELRDKVSSATTLVTDDSVRFLNRWREQHPADRVDLVYLDSWDLDALSPVAAALHCVREYEAVQHLLRTGSLLLVDDTPGSEEWLTSDLKAGAEAYRERVGLWPGKGMLLDLMLAEHPRVTKLHHRYQTLYRFE